MPLDGHSYLISQGWEGKGTGLRQGAISRPLAIPQKKNLAGLGKDRDEAFPFWDHLFAAAAKTIQVKCLSDDEDEITEDSSSNEVSIKRTSTGVFSTRRPIDGTPAASGTITPIDNECGATTAPRLSLMAIAKRDAAKRGLYSRFFRGPVLGPETLAEEEKRLTALVADAFAEKDANVESVKVTEHIEVQTIDERVVVDLEVSKSSHKKRKTRDTEGLHVVQVRDDNDEEARRERKRQRKEEKRKKEEKKEREMKRLNKEEKKKKRVAEESGMAVDQKVHVERSTPSAKRQKKKAEEFEDEEIKYKRRKEEKKRAKALRKRETNEVEEMTTIEDTKPKPPNKHLEKDSPSSHLRKVTASASAEDLTNEVKKKRKKRKQSGNPELESN